MQNLFTCFLLGILIWLMQRATPPLSEPTAYMGFLTVVSVLAARLTARWRVSPAAAALATGFLLREVGIVSDTVLSGIYPFTDLAVIWVGISLGAFLSPVRMLDRRLTVCAGLIVLGGGITASASQALVFHAGVETAIGTGILAVLSAPLFLPQNRESLSLSLLTTGFGLLLWGTYRVLHAPPVSVESAERLLVDLIVWAAGLELIHRILRKVRTVPGQYVVFSLLAFLVLLASRGLHIHPLVLAGLSGFALSMRSGSNRAYFPPLENLSKLLVLPVLADFAARLGAIRLDWPHWEFLVLYAAGMTLGKTAGGVLATRLTGLPFRTWVRTLPQGMLACMVLPQVRSLEGISPLSSGTMATEFILLCGIGVQALSEPLRSLSGWLEDRRARGRPRGDTEPHLREASD